MKPSDVPRDPMYLDPSTPPFIDGDGVAHLFSHADVLDARRNADRTFSTDLSYLVPPSQRVHIVWYFMWTMGTVRADGSTGRHQVLRGLIEDWFKKGAVAALAPMVRGIAEEAARALVASGTGAADLATDYAYVISDRTVSAVLGLPPGYEPWIREQLLTYQGMTFERSLEPEPPELMACLEEIVAASRAHPQEKLIDRLVTARATDLITDLELFGFVFSLLAAGADAGTNIATALGLLAEFDLLDQARTHLDDEDDRWWDRAGEEVVRYGTPFAARPVVATTDLVRGGLSIPTGSPVMLWLSAANRDPAVNGTATDAPDPGVFDPGRWPNHHLAFGWGRYYCLGAELARQQTQLAVKIALRYLPGLQLDQHKPYLRLAGLADRVASAPFLFDQARAERALGTESQFPPKAHAEPVR